MSILDSSISIRECDTRHPPPFSFSFSPPPPSISLYKPPFPQRPFPPLPCLRLAVLVQGQWQSRYYPSLLLLFLSIGLPVHSAYSINLARGSLTYFRLDASSKPPLARSGVGSAQERGRGDVVQSIIRRRAAGASSSPMQMAQARVMRLEALINEHLKVELQRVLDRRDALYEQIAQCLELRNNMTMLSSQKLGAVKTQVNLGCDFYVDASMCVRP